MIQTQAFSRTTVCQPQAIVNNDAPVGAYADANPVSVERNDASFAKVTVTLGATDIDLTSLALYSGPAAASGASDSTYSVVAGSAHSGTTGNGRLPQATDDNTVWVWFVDLRNDSIDNFLAVDIVFGNGTAGGYSTCDIELFHLNEAPSSATERGSASELFV